MITNLLPLYASSLGLVLLMAGFARRNRKTGWVKRRNTLVQDLLTLQMIWNDQDSATAAQPAMVVNSVPARRSELPDLAAGRLTTAETTEFSGQLATLQRALGEAAKIAQPVREHANAHVAA